MSPDKPEEKIAGFWCEPSKPIPITEQLERPLVWYDNSNTQLCKFCKQNNEPPEVYSSHVVRQNNITICPYLRRYVCKMCNATGDDAHTLSYCPLKKVLANNELFGHEYFQNMAAIKDSPFNSAGLKKKK